MKTGFLINKVLVITALLALSAMGQPLSNPASMPDSEKVIPLNTKDRSLSEPVNKVCPVKSEEIKHDSPLLIFEDKVIGFGHEDCLNNFIKNPEIYKKKLERILG